MDSDMCDKEYLKTLTILYVEDEEDIFVQVVQMLTRCCAEVVTARNGVEGLKAYRAHHPDIIISDINMPLMDGMAMAEHIRSSDQTTPLIFMTAIDSGSYLKRAIDLGVDKYVLKPIRRAQLSESLLYTAHRLRVERELTESDERFRLMFEESPDAHMLYCNGVFIDCNRKAEALFRCSREQLCGQSPVTLAPLYQPDGRLSSEVIAECIERALSHGSTTFELLRLRPDGTTFWADTSLNVISMKGHPVIYSSWRDISTRKELEITSKEIELQLLQATEAANVLNGLIAQICVVTEDGIISQSNRGWDSFVENAAGGTPLSCIGGNFFTICQQLWSGQQQSAEELIAGVRDVLTGTAQDYCHDFHYKSLGTETWYACKINSFTVNSRRYAVVVLLDISWRKATENRLIKLSRAIEQSPVSVVITDAEGTIEFVNPHFTSMTGYTAAEAIGKNPRILKSGDTKPEVFTDLWNTITAGNSWEGEFINRDKEGNQFTELAKISAIINEHGSITHYIAVTEDVTKSREVEAQLLQAKELAEAASRAKSSFLATMSHEIRTPMNGVLGMNAMLFETVLTPEQKSYAEIVRKSGENLLTIINEILDFSKIEAGKLDLEILDFDLRMTLEDTAELLALRSEEVGLELICHIDPAIPSYLKGDPGRVRQIVTNLVGNAIKFTRKGEVVIRATLMLEQSESVTILFEVQDTGIGIPASRLSAIFDSFTQVDSSTTRKFGGTGLGLAICRQLTQLMGGEIGVTSEEGTGSTFWFTLSLQKQTSQIPDIYKSMQILGRERLVNERILIVEDNATNRVLMKSLLRHWGCRHDVACHAMEGFEMLLEAAQSGDPFRIAILDQEMPDMDGVELGQKIKGEPLISATLMVMLTSIARRGDAGHLERIGFSGYLHKPVRQDQLYECLELVLGRDIEEKINANPTIPHGIITRHIIAESLRTGVRILLVEDNVINQKVAQTMLKSLGYRLDVVADGQEAVRAVQMISYDLVLMDCQMPVMNGFEATAVIRSGGAKKENCRVPIIAMTANASAEDREICLAAGMDDYVSKPVNKASLAMVIEKWLKSENASSLTDLVSNGELLNERMLFDKEELLANLDNDTDFIRSILDDSITALHEFTTAVQSFCLTHDCASIRTLSHTIKGVAGNISAPALREICARMETAARQNDSATVQEIYPELVQTINRTIFEIENTYF